MGTEYIDQGLALVHWFGYIGAGFLIGYFLGRRSKKAE